MSAESGSGSSINTSITSSLMSPSQTASFFSQISEDEPEGVSSQVLIGDYCSSYRPCRIPTVIRPLDIFDFNVTDDNASEPLVLDRPTINVLPIRLESRRIPYSRKYLRSLNLAVWSRAAEIKTLADLNLAVRYGIVILYTRIHSIRKYWRILIWRS